MDLVNNYIDRRRKICQIQITKNHQSQKQISQ